MDVEEFFTAREAARYSNLTPHMVNYLCRTGVLEPSGRKIRGRGRHRGYIFGDIVMLRALKRLLDSGVSVARLKRGFRELRKHHPEITPSASSWRYLMTDGRKIFLHTSKKTVLEALDGSGQFTFAFVVELHPISREIEDAIGAERKRA